MSGIAVATADIATAPWANPAMLTKQPSTEDFSLLMGFGVSGRDNDDLISDIDYFQAANDRYDPNNPLDPGSADALDDMTARISGIDGKKVAIDGSVSIPVYCI
ncbi:MAG: conjugal transfer protein TraF [Gammaproteobacteria bacterium]|nr:conjugal transfer protein TraF [Gammaproteobacteria bacterium]